MQPIKVILIGAGGRGNTYARFATEFPDKLKVVGVAEPHQIRRERIVTNHNIPAENIVHTWEDVFTRDKWADAVMICTQDNMHYGPAMAAIAQGYDILLEKPLAPTEKECTEIAEAAAKAGVKVVVCHSMRYTPFFNKIKEILDSGEIGDIVTYVHNENVGNVHHSHSFARGNWGNLERSSPMILAKSCHDMDCIQWLIGKDCLALTSFGSLKFFCKDYCPPNAPPRCTDGCPVDCPYDARKLYLESDSEWFRGVAVGHKDATDEEVLHALQTGPYGKCVFQTDNDVVDHQVTNMQFEDGITVMFSMASLTPDTSRSLKIMGTKGELKAHTGPHSIKITKFSDLQEREIIVEAGDGHSGGDVGIMHAFVDYLRGELTADQVSEAGISAKNHRLCFKAEESRVNGGVLVRL